MRDSIYPLWGKREIAFIPFTAIPSTATAAFLGMRDGWEGSSGQVLRDAGGQLGISLVFMLPQKGTPSEIERVFAAMEQQRPDAVLVSGEGDLYAHRQLIVELACQRRADWKRWGDDASTGVVDNCLRALALADLSPRSVRLCVGLSQRSVRRLRKFG